MPPVDELNVLVPVDVSEPETPPLEVVDLLGPSRVVLLGYFPVPRQAEPALIKDEYEADAEGRLREIAEGRPDLTEVLVFTHDREATIDRVADQYDCDAVLSTGHVDELERILVPLRGDANLERIVSVVASLLDVSGATATLFHAVAEGADPSQGEFLLRGAVDRLADYGIDEGRVDGRLGEGGDPSAEIAALGNEYDLVVLGETEPSLVDRIIGDLLSRIVENVDRPALIVRDVE
jgi:nucleotide-binding universal stress UspA family protein